MASPTLNTVPLEVLEHIAYFVATQQLKGPPSDLVSLYRTCKVIYNSISFSSNQSLYASIFRFKFDTAAPIRRLGSENVTVSCLADELRRRFEAMQRIRCGRGSRATLSEKTYRQHDLWMAVFMMLENDGKNALQLKVFAKVEPWLHTYFLATTGGSCTQSDMLVGSWPRDNDDNKLALWLLCLCDADGPSLTHPSQSYSDLLRTYAVAADKYPITRVPWIDFSHPFSVQTANQTVYRHFNCPFLPLAPATALSAILGYISRLKQPGGLIWTITGDSFSSGDVQSQPRRQVWDWGSLHGSSSERWDCDWERCAAVGISVGNVEINGLQSFFRPGSFEGAWEGLFTYAEFGVYAAILSGEPPQTITGGAIGQNLQVWRIREYDLFSLSLDSDVDILTPGDASNAFFPSTTLVQEEKDYAIFTHASRPKGTVYRRAVHLVASDNRSTNLGRLRDVILIGEGHSSWGDFKLRGRIRASDALVTIMKEYDGQDRGRWIYRGFLVGGKYIGRWRDVMTPMNMVGYEGGFELIQRV